MDHASISQDREDLERYRMGLKPIERKEYICKKLLTIDEVIADAMKFLEEQDIVKKSDKAKK